MQKVNAEIKTCCETESKQMSKNNLKKVRESLMISKAELSRSANISRLTITRIESGMSCRKATKQKIVLALGLKMSDKKKIFSESTT